MACAGCKPGWRRSELGRVEPAGEPIRFRHNGTGRWIDGKVAGIALDGSIKLHDRDGSARNLRAEMVEVRRPGSRGRLRWQPVSDVAITWEQLELWSR
ncbi:MAG: hypothetical protein FD127_2885 [Acidimicrobiaceae bacterium]|nr:MAG: hypothetical protein FD127_2885 [Acidimicrobiaceae bacterium]